MATIEEYAPTGAAVNSVERVGRRAKPGRVCRDSDCPTRLSVYNDGNYCSLHAPMVVPRTRGKKLGTSS